LLEQERTESDRANAVAAAKDERRRISGSHTHWCRALTVFQLRMVASTDNTRPEGASTGCCRILRSESRNKLLCQDSRNGRVQALVRPTFLELPGGASDRRRHAACRDRCQAGSRRDCWRSCFRSRQQFANDGSGKAEISKITIFNFPGERDKGNFGGLEDTFPLWM